jgi:hypothetical protein
MDVTEKLLKRYEAIIVDTISKIGQTTNTVELVKLAHLLETITFVYNDLSVIKSVGGQIVVPEDALGKLNLAKE